MNVEQAIRTAAKIAGKSLNSVSRDVGKNDNYLSVTFGRGSVPKSDTLAQLADTCGYSLALVPSSHVPPDAIVIDGAPLDGTGRPADAEG